MPFCHGCIEMKQTKKQKELMQLINKKGLTLLEASVVLKKNKHSIWKMLKRIRIDEAEGISHFKQNGREGLGYQAISHFPIRLHNIQFHITPSYIPERYHRRRLKGDGFRVENNTIWLSRKTFEIYSHDDFWGENADVCMRKANDYFFNTLLPKLESLLGVVIVKETSSGVRMVRSHYAEVGNELAQDVNKRKEKLEFRGEDGKIWLQVDKSLKGDELEAVHPVQSRDDMNKIKPFMDDLRTMDAPILLSELIGLLKIQQQANNNTALGLQGVVEALKVLMPGRYGEVPKEMKGSQVKPDYVG